MILIKNPNDPIKQQLALFGGQILDALCILAQGVDRFPARYGVGADDGMFVAEGCADVFGTAALGGVHGEFVFGGDLLEFLCLGDGGFSAGGRDGFEGWGFWEVGSQGLKWNGMKWNGAEKVDLRGSR